MSFSRRLRYTVYALSTGGITLGVVQGVSGIAFSDIWTNFLTQIFSVLIALIFGQNPTQFSGGSGLV